MKNRKGKTAISRGNDLVKKPLYYHIVAWFFFILYENLWSYVLNSKSLAFWDTSLHYIFNIVLFYINANVVFPYARKFNRITPFNFVLAVIIEIMIYVPFNYSVNTLFIRYGIPTVWSSSTKLAVFLAATSWRALYILFLSTGYWLGVHLYRSRVKIEELKHQQLIDKNEQLELQKKIVATENAFLKAQINPHFLFNSLNFIYNTVYKVSGQAAEAVMLLSEITRYSLQKSDPNGLQPLEDEIEQIRNIIELNQIRFDQRLQIKLITQHIVPDFKIPSLLFITFVENIFKYGDLSDPEHPALVKIEVADGKLHFYTENVIQKRRPVAGHGIGIENARLRLQSAFPQKHHLESIITENLYVLNLEIEMAYAEELYPG